MHQTTCAWGQGCASVHKLKLQKHLCVLGVCQREVLQRLTKVHCSLDNSSQWTSSLYTTRNKHIK